MATDLEKITPAQGLSQSERDNMFQHLFRRLAAFRNTAELYSLMEYNISPLPEPKKLERRNCFNQDLGHWAQDLLQYAWIVLDQPNSGETECPTLDPYVDTSIGDLGKLPPTELFSRMLNTILFLQIANTKQYSSRTRAFLSTFGPLDEEVIVSTLKNPEQAIKEMQKHAETITSDHAKKGRTSRLIGMGLGAVAGGVLVGVTGGLAAPLVGAGMATVLGWLGVSGTAAGLLASGLAGSSVVCGALFGAYGAQSSARLIERHTREIRDLALIPVRKLGHEETLAVRICVSGWLSSPEDVTTPWTVFDEGCDTFALRWEVEALQQLSNALVTLVKTHTMKYIKVEILKRTVFASLMSSLAPIALLKIGQIIDNPWMNAKALAVKAGAVLGDLLSQRVFGNRPVTLTGYSLGALVIFEALKHLATLSPPETSGLVQDVFLFGTPTPTDATSWTSIRRLVAGRLVNGYSTDDYVLAVLSRVSNVSWKVAGLEPVDVMGVENVDCGVDGHLKWRGMIGKSLQQVGVSGIADEQVDLQMKDVAEAMELEDELNILEEHA